MLFNILVGGFDRGPVLLKPATNSVFRYLSNQTTFTSPRYVHTQFLCLFQEIGAE